MRLFHRHRWCLIDRTYASPLSGGTLTGLDYGPSERLSMGLTTFLFQCEDPLCRQVKKVECLGKRMIEQEKRP